MNWLKQVPASELIYLAEAGLSGLSDALKELKAAKLAWKPDSEAAEVRLQAAWVIVADRRDNYNAILDELHARGLK